MLKKTLLLLCISSQCLSQTGRLSRYELGWALLHPLAALKVNKIGRQAGPLYKAAMQSPLLDSYAGGGRLDAFRHVFYMAAFAQKIKVSKVRKLGRAHEKANYHQFLNSKKEEGEVPDSLSTVMDLQNNELGLKLGCENKAINLAALKELVVSSIGKGEAVIMKRGKTGALLDCNNQLLLITTKRWNLPKCLVPSNYVYKD